MEKAVGKRITNSR